MAAAVCGEPPFTALITSSTSGSLEVYSVGQRPKGLIAFVLFLFIYV